MNSASTDTSSPSWRIKKLNQAGKTYVQACIQPDKSSPLFTVGLGYLVDDVITWTPDPKKAEEESYTATPEAVLENLRAGGVRLLSLSEFVPKRGPEPARDVPLVGAALKDAIKRFAFQGATTSAIVAQLSEPGPADYKEMTLSQFVGNPAKNKAEATGPFSSWRVTEISDVSWESERYTLVRLQNSPLGKVKMKDQSAVRWQTYITSPEMVKLSPRTRKLVEQAYRAIQTYGSFMGACTKHTFLRIKGSSKRTREVTPLLPAEVYALINAASSPMHRALYGVGFGEGLRPSELLRMRWEDVDYDRKIIRVRGTKTEKSGDPIPLTSFAEGYLREWQAACGGATTGAIWTYHGEDIASMKKAFVRAGERSGLKDAGKRVHPYVMRHSFATLAASSGMPITTAQAVLRHTDLSMLWGVYVSWGAVAESAPGIEKLPLSKADADAAGLIQRGG